jgi:hypothetical protein
VWDEKLWRETLKKGAVTNTTARSKMDRLDLQFTRRTGGWRRIQWAGGLDTNIDAGCLPTVSCGRLTYNITNQVWNNVTANAEASDVAAWDWYFVAFGSKGAASFHPVHKGTIIAEWAAPTINTLHRGRAGEGKCAPGGQMVQMHATCWSRGFVKFFIYAVVIVLVVGKRNEWIFAIEKVVVREFLESLVTEKLLVVSLEDSRFCRTCA